MINDSYHRFIFVNKHLFHKQSTNKLSSAHKSDSQIILPFKNISSLYMYIVSACIAKMSALIVISHFGRFHIYIYIQSTFWLHSLIIIVIASNNRLAVYIPTTTTTTTTTLQLSWPSNI